MMDHGRSYRMIESSLFEILSLINPTEDDRRKRCHVINEFKAVIQSLESLRGATVEPFGSFVSNLYTRWGDLDMSVMLPNNAFPSTVGKSHKRRLLSDIMNVLRRNGAQNLQLIPSARVPLLIFQSSYENISCDISICNYLGHIKSKFLLWISEIDDRFRDLVLLVKEWAKAKNINDPKTGTLNSYSLSLLVIFHLQTCTPAIIPPLKDIYMGNISDDLTGASITFERSVHDTSAANMARFKSQGIHQVNRSSLSELFVSFFEKFSRIETLSVQYAICTFTGQWESIMSNAKWMEKTHKIIIEDPFEQPDNAARAVSRNGLCRISAALRETYNMFSSPSVIFDKNHLIASLVRSHIKSLQGVSHQGYSRTHASGTRHPFHQAGRVSPQFQYPHMQIQHLQSRPTPSTTSVHGYGRAHQVQHLQGHPSSSTSSVQSCGRAGHVHPLQAHLTSSTSSVRSNGPIHRQRMWRPRNS